MLLVGCGDNFLDVVPTDKLSDDTFWKTENDAKLALGACYSDWESYMNIVYLDCGSDNGFQKNNFEFTKIANGTLNSTSKIGTQGNWVDDKMHSWFLYDKIRKYNNFLEKVANIEMDEKLKKQYLAEVRFLRAYDYLQKVMLYGDMPLVKEVISSTDEANMERTPQKEIQEFILKELEEIHADLPVQNMIESKGHVTQGSALALKARAALYFGKFDIAQDAARRVIAMPCYELYKGSGLNSYQEMFRPSKESSNKEAIMSIKYDKESYPQRLTQLMLPASSGGYTSLDVIWNLIEAYQMINGKYIDELDSNYDKSNPFKDRDPRMAFTVLYPGANYYGKIYDPFSKTINGKPNVDCSSNNKNGARGGMSVQKFVYPIENSLLNNFDADIMVIRLAEIYLIFAECALQTGVEQDLALGYINDIRDRAGMPPADQLNERLVRYERRVELAFEGLRYFDIKRWDLGPSVLNGKIYGCKPGIVHSDGSVTWTGEHIVLEERKFYPERHYLLPIPQSELDKNPNMRQNPGY